MRLVSFHVRVFRNIIDSGPITVLENTCLVGKNEAGKSALISALHRLNPAKPVPMALLDEYPRWLKKEHEITGQLKDAVPIAATYRLADAELAGIEAQFGKGVLSSADVVASRKYTGDTELKIPIDQTAFLKGFSAAHVAPSLTGRLSAVQTSEQLIKLLDEISVEVTPGTPEPTPAAQEATGSSEACRDTRQRCEPDCSNPREDSSARAQDILLRAILPTPRKI